MYHSWQRTARFWHGLGPIAPLTFKAVLFGGTLWYAQASEFTLGSILLFLTVAIVCYLQPVFKTLHYSASCMVLLAVALLLTSRFTITLPGNLLYASGLGQLAFAAAFAIIFFALLGIKNMTLSRRYGWYTLVYVALVYGVELLFFAWSRQLHAITGMLLLYAFIYVLVREYFVFYGHTKGRLITVIAATISVLAAQLAWVATSLPLTFSNSASLLTLIVLLATALIERYLRGALSARTLRFNGILFVILVVLIAIATRWTI